jgi:hypothetical protein
MPVPVTSRVAGFGPRSIAKLAELRTAYEAYERGQLGCQETQQVADTYADRPWFDRSWVPHPSRGTGLDDMDFDPAASISLIRCPVLAFYGADEWIAVQKSISTWRPVRQPRPADHPRDPGTTHHPALGGQQDLAAICPQYAARLTTWLDDVISTAN